MKKFIITEKGPFVRSVDSKINSTEKIMNNVIIALLPIVLFGFVLFGLLPYIKGVDYYYYVGEIKSESFNFYHMLKPLLNVIVACLSSIVFEGLYFLIFKGVKGFKNVVVATKDSFAIIPGLIISLLFPANIPFYVLIFACFIGNIIFKMLFGGLGHNIFNPALIGYGFAILAFSGVINGNLNAQNSMMADLLDKLFNNVDKMVVSSATPLATLKSLAKANANFGISSDIVSNYGGLLNLFIGFRNGNLGEVSSLLAIVGCIWMIAKKVINWRVPVFYIGTSFVMFYIVGLVNGIASPWFAAYNIFTGGLFFGAVFMATEPVTTPKTPNGKIIFGIALGIFTTLFRLIGMYAEGVATALLFLCLFSQIIDKFASVNRGPIITKKIVFNYVLLAVLFGAIAFYTVYKSTNISSDNAFDFFKSQKGIVDVLINKVGGGF